MKILLAGASGFVGTEVTKVLVERGHDLTVLLHSDKAVAHFNTLFPKVSTVVVDVTNPASVHELAGKIAAPEAIIYLPGLIREFPSKGITFQGVHVEGVRNLIALAQKLGVKRWLQMSALGAAANSTTGYFKTKWEAEQLVRASKLDWTIFRPSVVFGEEPTTQMNFVGELAGVIRSAPFIPVFGDGKYRMQPIALSVVAKAFVDALELPAAIGNSYDLGGPDKIEYTYIMKMIAHALGKKKPVLHIPFFFIEILAGLLGGFSFFPISRDQLTMLKLENIVPDPAQERAFKATFNPRQTRLQEGLARFFGRA